MNQSEHLYQEIQTLERQLRERDEEIARLREELSRAAVTITTLRGRLDEVVTQCSTTHTLTHRDVQRAVENARRTLSNPSPLSDAAQEVLEAAVEVRNHASKEPPVKTSLVGAMIALHDAVDRHLALLEGRDRKDG